MTVVHENIKLLVFGGGNKDRHLAMLRGNTLQNWFAGMLVVKMADQPASLRQSGPDVSETML